MSYEQSAEVYDAIYSYKNYRDEARRVQALVEKYTQRTGKRLLDVACGTGLHDQYLVKWYDVTGVDLSPGQLAVARRRLPDMVFHEADMTTFDLGEQYDVVTCLFSAIGHVTQLADMKQAVARMAAHLEPGGVLLIEPWLLPHMWREDHLSTVSVDEPDLKVTRNSRGQREGNLIRLTMDHKVTLPSGTQAFVEHHEVRMYTEAEFLEAFDLAGLSGFYDPAGINDNGRGIFVATKPMLAA